MTHPAPLNLSFPTMTFLYRPLLPLLLGAAIATAQDADHAHDDHTHGHSFADFIVEDPATDMLEAANLFLASLSDTEKKKTLFATDGDHREEWFYVPGKFIKPRGSSSASVPMTQAT